MLQKLLSWFSNKVLAKKITNSITEKSKLMPDKQSDIISDNLDQIKVDIEKEKIKIEKEKLAIEDKKLAMESEKIKIIIKTANIKAIATLRAAYIRTCGSVGIGFFIVYTTYKYFKPIEEELNKKTVALNNTKKEEQNNAELFMRAEEELKGIQQILAKAEEDFVYKSKNQEAIVNYNSFKDLMETKTTNEIARIPGIIKYNHNKKLFN